METAGDRKQGCLLGAFLGDALAMPVHWYYDRAALARDYGRVVDLVAPKNPHADSILWRSSYAAIGPKGEILHDQAQYWGKRGVHYHQFLRAGENTLNMQLALELLASLRANRGYGRDDYVRRYIDFMTAPGRHHTPTSRNVTGTFSPNTRAAKSRRIAGPRTFTSAAWLTFPFWLFGMRMTKKPHSRPCASMSA